MCSKSQRELELGGPPLVLIWARGTEGLPLRKGSGSGSGMVEGSMRDSLAMESLGLNNRYG